MRKGTTFCIFRGGRDGRQDIFYWKVLKKYSSKDSFGGSYNEIFT